MPKPSNTVTIQHSKDPTEVHFSGHVLAASLGDSYTIFVEKADKLAYEEDKGWHVAFDLRLNHNKPEKMPPKDFKQECKQLRDSLIKAAKKHGFKEVPAGRDTDSFQDGDLAGRAGTLRFYDPAVTYKTKRATTINPDRAANAFAEKARAIFEEALASMQTPAAELETSAQPAKSVASKRPVKGA